MVQAYEVQPYFPFSILHYKVTRDGYRKALTDAGSKYPYFIQYIYIDDVLAIHKQSEFIAEHLALKSPKKAQTSPQKARKVRPLPGLGAAWYSFTPALRARLAVHFRIR